MLSTAFALTSLLFAVIAAVAAYVSSRNAIAVDSALTALNTANRNLRVASDRLNALEGRLDRLAGRVYSQARKPAVDEQVAADTRRAASEDFGNHESTAHDDDPEFEQLLRLQSAPAVSPAKPNGR